MAYRIRAESAESAVATALAARAEALFADQHARVERVIDDAYRTGKLMARGDAEGVRHPSKFEPFLRAMVASDKLPRGSGRRC